MFKGTSNPHFFDTGEDGGGLEAEENSGVPESSKDKH